MVGLFFIAVSLPAALIIRKRQSRGRSGGVIPRHECVDFAARPAIGNALEGLSEPGKRIDVIHLCRLCRPANYAEHLLQHTI